MQTLKAVGVAGDNGSGLEDWIVQRTSPINFCRLREANSERSIEDYREVLQRMQDCFVQRPDHDKGTKHVHNVVLGVRQQDGMTLYGHKSCERSWVPTPLAGDYIPIPRSRFKPIETDMFASWQQNALALVVAPLFARTEFLSIRILWQECL